MNLKRKEVGDSVADGIEDDGADDAAAAAAEEEEEHEPKAKVVKKKPQKKKKKAVSTAKRGQKRRKDDVDDDKGEDGDADDGTAEDGEAFRSAKHYPPQTRKRLQHETFRRFPKPFMVTEQPTNLADFAMLGLLVRNPTAEEADATRRKCDELTRHVIEDVVQCNFFCNSHPDVMAAETAGSMGVARLSAKRPETLQLVVNGGLRTDCGLPFDAPIGNMAKKESDKVFSSKNGQLRWYGDGELLLGGQLDESHIEFTRLLYTFMRAFVQEKFRPWKPSVLMDGLIAVYSHPRGVDLAIGKCDKDAFRSMEETLQRQQRELHEGRIPEAKKRKKGGKKAAVVDEEADEGSAENEEGPAKSKKRGRTMTTTKDKYGPFLSFDMFFLCKFSFLAALEQPLRAKSAAATEAKEAIKTAPLLFWDMAKVIQSYLVLHREGTKDQKEGTTYGDRFVVPGFHHYIIPLGVHWAKGGADPLLRVKSADAQDKMNVMRDLSFHPRKEPKKKDAKKETESTHVFGEENYHCANLFLYMLTGLMYGWEGFAAEVEVLCSLVAKVYPLLHKQVLTQADNMRKMQMWFPERPIILSEYVIRAKTGARVYYLDRLMHGTMPHSRVGFALKLETTLHRVLTSEAPLWSGVQDLRLQQMGAHGIPLACDEAWEYQPVRDPKTQSREAQQVIYPIHFDSVQEQPNRTELMFREQHEEVYGRWGIKELSPMQAATFMVDPTSQSGVDWTTYIRQTSPTLLLDKFENRTKVAILEGMRQLHSPKYDKMVSPKTRTFHLVTYTLSLDAENDASRSSSSSSSSSGNSHAVSISPLPPRLAQVPATTDATVPRRVIIRRPQATQARQATAPPALAPPALEMAASPVAQATQATAPPALAPPSPQATVPPVPAPARTGVPVRPRIVVRRPTAAAAP